ncbi:hypothetical protein D3C76_1746560 [compost metagenome]
MMIIICCKYINKLAVFPSQKGSIGRMCADCHIYEQSVGAGSRFGELGLNDGSVKSLVGYALLLPACQPE